MPSHRLPIVFPQSTHRMPIVCPAFLWIFGYSAYFVHSLPTVCPQSTHSMPIDCPRFPKKKTLFQKRTTPFLRGYGSKRNTYYAI